MEELSEKQLEQVTGGYGEYDHHRGNRGGYGHYGGGYQEPSINYSDQTSEQDFSYHLKETSTQYSIY